LVICLQKLSNWAGKLQIPIYEKKNYFNFSRIEENIFFNSVASLESLFPSSVYFSLFVFCLPAGKAGILLFGAYPPERLCRAGQTS